MARRRHRRKVFSERQKDAIIRLSQAKVETKAYPTSISLVDYLTSTGYVSPAASHAFQANVYNYVPTAQFSNPAPDDQTFVGNEFVSRGLRWEGWFWTGDGIASPGGSFDVWFRFTVFEVSDFVPAPAQITNLSAVLDPDYPRDPVVSKWNVDYTKIRFQKSFKLDNNGSVNAMVKRKFYIPIQRKIEKAFQLTDAVPSMQQIKGLQVYWALEMFAPGQVGNFNSFVNGRINTTLYFKDS